MLRVRQIQRQLPLAPAAALGVGAPAQALARRLLELTDAQLSRLKGLAGSALVVVLGATDDLPWAEGVSYFGREPSAPGLYLACATSPSVPAQLLLGALLRRFDAPRPSLPLLVSLEPPLVVSTASAEPLSRARISAWLEEEPAP